MSGYLLFFSLVMIALVTPVLALFEIHTRTPRMALTALFIGTVSGCLAVAATIP